MGWCKAFWDKNHRRNATRPNIKHYKPWVGQVSARWTINSDQSENRKHHHCFWRHWVCWMGVFHAKLHPKSCHSAGGWGLDVWIDHIFEHFCDRWQGSYILWVQPVDSPTARGIVRDMISPHRPLPPTNYSRGDSLLRLYPSSIRNGMNNIGNNGDLFACSAPETGGVFALRGWLIWRHKSSSSLRYLSTSPPTPYLYSCQFLLLIWYNCKWIARDSLGWQDLLIEIIWSKHVHITDAHCNTLKFNQAAFKMHLLNSASKF